MVFSFMNLLEYLDLSSNNLTSLGKNLFNDLTNLVYLDLSSNGLAKIENYVFKNLFKLTSLNLNLNNDSMVLDEHSLYGLSSLQTMNISAEVLVNDRSNKVAVVNGLKSLRVHKVINGRVFYESVSVVGNYVGNYSSVVECHLVIYFIRFNIIYNLKTDYDMFVYNRNCFGMQLDKSLL